VAREGKPAVNVYLAASWSLKNEMRQVRKLLNQAGHRVTSRWLDEPAEQGLAAHDLADDHEIGARHAAQVLEDIDARPLPGWYREGFEGGQLRWITDEVHGRAGIWFREIAEVPIAAQETVRA
jgi:hypothetical protein